MALKITIDGLRNVLSTIRIVVNFTPTAKDDAVLAMITPVIERVLANQDFPLLLDYVNLLLEGKFAAAPADYDAEAFVQLANLCAEQVKAEEELDKQQ